MQNAKLPDEHLQISILFPKMHVSLFEETKPIIFLTLNLYLEDNLMKFNHLYNVILS